jgi:hypothetical protein
MTTGFNGGSGETEITKGLTSLFDRIGALERVALDAGSVR